MILLCKLPEDSVYYPYYIANTYLDKMTYHYRDILSALSNHFYDNYRSTKYSIYTEKDVDRTSLKIDITDLCTTNAEKTEAAIYNKYPELLL